MNVRPFLPSPRTVLRPNCRISRVQSIEQNKANFLFPRIDRSPMIHNRDGADEPSLSFICRGQKASWGLRTSTSKRVIRLDELVFNGPKFSDSKRYRVRLTTRIRAMHLLTA